MKVPKHKVSAISVLQELESLHGNEPIVRLSMGGEQLSCPLPNVQELTLHLIKKPINRLVLVTSEYYHRHDVCVRVGSPSALLVMVTLAG